MKVGKCSKIGQGRKQVQERGKVEKNRSNTKDKALITGPEGGRVGRVGEGRGRRGGEGLEETVKCNMY